MRARRGGLSGSRGTKVIEEFMMRNEEGQKCSWDCELEAREEKVGTETALMST